MSYLIDFQNVSFTYAGAKQPAIQDINLEIQPGEIVLITGPAGSGKTTLCSCINGLIPHYHEGSLKGHVKIGQYDTRKSRVGGLASLVGMVFQDPESQLITNNVLDEIAFGPENLGVSREEINQRIQAALVATRLNGYEEREPHNLSGGEQQACVIAATYAMHPEIYVMDEPLANLDPAGRAYILNLVVQVAKDRAKTLVIVEHSLEETLPLVERVIIMNKGKIIKDGPTHEILKGGDIPQVFKRPDIMRLAEEFKLDGLPLNPQQFQQYLRSKYQLNKLSPSPYLNGHKPSGQAIIEFENVCFSYDDEKETLEDISLKIYPGELVAIMGRNGSGKTTLVRHIIGLQQPSVGRVTVNGMDVAHTPTHVLARDVGFCFQNPNHQIVSFTVREEMLFGLKSHNIDPAEFDQRIQEALQIVDMEDMLNQEVFDLGKGQKQRLTLASVLTLKPKILVIDEPTTGQDPEMVDEIFTIIKRLNDAGTTILLITHKVDYAAMYATRALVLKEGRISFDGHIQALMQNHQLMTENSLELPELTKLAVELGDLGVPNWVVSYEDMKDHLRQIVGVQHGN
jgi:energy-coupling factor transporter ATP-binding protein EcfA2